MSDPAVEKPRRSLFGRLVRVLASVLLGFVVVIEIGSRACDWIVERRKRDPVQAAEMVRQRHESDLVEKLSYGYLVYGNMLRASQFAGMRNGPHPYLGYALTPSYDTPPGTELQAHHNALGFRGKETTWVKPAGVYRIVTTGGSSVYGQSESCDAAVWSQRVEDNLNAGAGGRKFEVVNAGVPGWTSFEMLINLELRALDLSPDLVIIYETINDMRAALYNKGGEPQLDNTQWRAVWPVDRPSDIEKVLEKSRTYLVWRRFMTNYTKLRADLLHFGVKNLAVNFEEDAYTRVDPSKPIPELGFLTYRRNLENMITLARARGAKVLIVTQACPRWHLAARRSTDDQIEGLNRIQNIQREVANALDVRLFECAEIMEKASETELLTERDRQLAAHPGMSAGEAENEARKVVKGRAGLFFSEVHPTDRGSEMIAKLVSEYLMASPLLATQPK